MMQQPTERWIFVATGAAVGRVHSEYQCEFWSENPLQRDPDPNQQAAAGPGFDPGRLTPLDLERTPSRSTTPDDVQVDDFTTLGGFSTLGPGFPAGHYLANVYLEQRYRDSLPPDRRPALPPVGGQGFDYEYTTVYYWPGTADPRAGLRYVGVHARILSSVPVSGTTKLVEVELFQRGRSKVPGQKPIVTTWIDLNAISQCDPQGAGGLTRVDPAALQAGPMYIESTYASTLSVGDIKIPTWRGL